MESSGQFNRARPSVVMASAPRRQRLSRGLLWALIVLGVLTVGYPLIGEWAGHPLAVFVLPVLFVAALGTPKEAMLVGALAVLISLVEGDVVSELGARRLTARMVVIGSTAVGGVVLATIRSNSERAIRDADRTGEMMETFQRGLVPRPDPPPGVVVEARYVPGEERLMLGGDFLDALRLPDGSLGFVLGDVCGHGPDAAALGAAMRAGWKTIATHAMYCPATWVRVLDEAFFSHGRHPTFATVCTGRVAPDGLVRLVSCGHPWPIVLGQDAAVVQPHVTRPLGVRGAEFAPAETEFALAPGSTLFLYTDGLVENRRRPELASEEHLVSYLQQNPKPDLDALFEAFGGEGFSDDVAVMCISLA